MKFTTTITSNGSKWAGEAPDDIDTLIGVLGTHMLERWTGNPVRKIAPGTVRFFGNFHDLSHVFNITTDDPDIIRRLVAAIRANRARRHPFLHHIRPARMFRD